MTLGKYIDGGMNLVEVENGVEVGGTRTEQELRVEGYEDVCTINKPSEEAAANYEHITNGWMQIWQIQTT